MAGASELLALLLEFTWLQVVTGYAILEAILRLIFPPKLKSLKGETILVTGAGRGIGREIVFHLAETGSRIVCWDINEKLNNETVQTLRQRGVAAYGYTVDVGDREKVSAAADKVKKEVGEVSIVINNAGITNIQPFIETSHERIETLFRVNVMSNFWVLKEFLPHMFNVGRGHVVSVASGAACLACKNLVPYGATKHAIHGYMEGLREEVRLHPKKPNIKLTIVYPFFCDTEINAGSVASTRFPFLIPILGPEPTAKIIVDGMRREDEYVYTPKFFGLMTAASKFLPNKAVAAAAEFFQCTLEPERN